MSAHYTEATPAPGKRKGGISEKLIIATVPPFGKGLISLVGTPRRGAPDGSANRPPFKQPIAAGGLTLESPLLE